MASAGGRLAGEVVSNMPFRNMVASVGIEADSQTATNQRNYLDLAELLSGDMKNRKA